MSQGNAEKNTESQGGATTQAYDPDGNLETVTHANGAITTHIFDPLDRLTDLATANGIGTLLQSYAFTLAATGHRTRIDELDGTSRRVNPIPS